VRIWTLGSRGREHLASLGAEVPWQFRLERLRYVSYGQISHTLLLTRFLVAVQVWARGRPDVSLLQKRISYEMQELQKVIPDGWLLLENAGNKFALVIELDRGMEQGAKFKQYVKGRIELIRSSKYKETFGVPAVIVSYLTTGQTPEYRQTRARAMNSWTEEVLQELKLKNWAALFRFTAIEFATLYDQAASLFEEPVWLMPYTKEKVGLFD
jgi:hypothetical protein